MSKPFTIIYEGNPKWKGLNVSVPENKLDVSESPALSNFFFRDSELRSRPTFRQVFIGPDGGNAILGHGSFLDANNVPHTFALTSNGLWQLAQNNSGPGAPANPWQPLNPLLDGSGVQHFVNANVPATFAIFNTTMYFTNGGPNVFYWDGILPAGLVLNTTVIQQQASGSVPQISGSIGGLYIYEMNDSICIANCTEVVPAAPNTTSAATVVQTLPQRIRWSANGIPNVWDPTVNTSAGFNDIVEVPDNITGVMTLGSQVAYIFRTNGITEQGITGSGLLPFSFNHLWGAQKGIGNVYPWSVDSYGSVGFFISNVDVYQVSVYSFEEIGSKQGARDAIRADLANATSIPFGAIVDLWNPGYVHLCYMICIPLAGGMRVYLYSLEDKNWTSWFVTGSIPTGTPKGMWL